MMTPRRLSILLVAAMLGLPGRVAAIFQDIPPPTRDSPPTGQNKGTVRQSDRWAVIVGIAKYKDARYNTLKYADRDAESLYELLQTGPGGGFPRDHIRKLTNEDATTSAITSALRTFLKKPAKEDLVLIYFSCHGVPDPERPANLYFVTHDTDGKDIAGTALPMGEVNTCLRETLLSERVVILADACHAGGVVGAGLGSKGDPVADAAAVNTYIRRISEARPGTAWLTSAEAAERSVESEQWGGGHGIFTYSLLEGMSGKADRSTPDEDIPGEFLPPDGIVTLGELIDYVSDNVKHETKYTQHPAVGVTRLARQFTMAVTRGVAAQDHYQIGRQLLELGRHLDERRLLQSAVFHLGEAQRSYALVEDQERLADAARWCGLAHLALDENDEAETALMLALKQGADKAPADTEFLLGIAQERLLRTTQPGIAPSAIASLGHFLDRHPDEGQAAWAKTLISRLKRPKPPQGKRYALLIGVVEERIGKGPANDVLFVRDTLREVYAIPDKNIVTLDKAATLGAVTTEIKKLKASMNAQDEALIYFSGNAGLGFIALADYRYGANKGEKPSGVLDFKQTVDEVNGFPGRVTFVITSTPVDADFKPADTLGIRPPHTLILGTRPGAHAIYTAEGGPFTNSLFRVLRRSSTYSSVYEILDRAGMEINSRFGRELREMDEDSAGDQTPVVYGDPGSSFLFERCPSDHFAISVRPRRLRSIVGLKGYHAAILKECGGAPLAGLRGAFGLSFLERRLYQEAAEEFESELARFRTAASPDVAIGLGIARLRAGRYDEAADNIRKAAETLDPALREGVAAAAARTRTLSSRKVTALLVGIDDYFEPSVQDLRGAVNDVQAIRQLLEQKIGKERLDLTVLPDGKATRAAVLDAFKTLVSRSRESPALFYFAGYGSVTQSGQRAIVACDSRTNTIPDITVDELAKLAGSSRATNLLTVIDAGCLNRPGSSGSIPPDVKAARTLLRKQRGGLESPRFLPLPHQTRELSTEGLASSGKPASRVLARPVRIGRISIYVDLDDAIELTDDAAERLTGISRVRGGLTVALEQSLRKADLARLTYAQWAAAATEKLEYAEVQVEGEIPDERVLGNPTSEGEIAALLVRTQSQRFRSLEPRLKALIERRADLAAGAYLDLGIAEAARGDFQSAVKDLHTALEKAARAKSPIIPECHYHLGRVLFESRKDVTRAISELTQAAAANPADPRVHYYRGQATRVLIEEDLRTRVREDLRTYIEKGAPLGHHRQVEMYLNSSTSTGQDRGDTGGGDSPDR
jgi:tetratricopeptide (TPR) repeat protein